MISMQTMDANSRKIKEIRVRDGSPGKGQGRTHSCTHSFNVMQFTEGKITDSWRIAFPDGKLMIFSWVYIALCCQVTVYQGLGLAVEVFR